MAMSPDCLSMLEMTGAVIGVEAVERVIVADRSHDAANQGLKIDVRLGCDFSGNDDQAGGRERFAGNPAIGS
ncbi:MAG: hypothetical protein QOJ42_4122 [Acidobacteriaceae bacterium]|nr:hypothetical protein [Acidobacteriaceae bacterium]